MKICTYIYLQNSIIYLSRMRASTLFSAQVLFKNVVRKREKKTLEGIKLKSNSQFSQSKQWMSTWECAALPSRSQVAFPTHSQLESHPRLHEYDPQSVTRRARESCQSGGVKVGQSWKRVVALGSCIWIWLSPSLSCTTLTPPNLDHHASP